MTEDRVRAHWLKRIKQFGGKNLKTETLETGWPDELAIMPGGVHLWVELKRPVGGRMGTRQSRNLTLLGRLGCHAAKLKSPEEIDIFLASKGFVCVK